MSKIVFFRIINISVSCPHAQLRGRTIIKKLWTFFGPCFQIDCRSGSLSVTVMLGFSGKANTSIHGLGEDDTTGHRGLWACPHVLFCIGLIRFFNGAVTFCRITLTDETN